MNDQSGPEKAAAAREARDAIASRPGTSGSIARDAALRRYLGAQSYREKRIEDRTAESDAGETAADES